MAKELKTIDIGNVPELLRLVEEVRVTNEPRLLRLGLEDLAILKPVKTKRRKTIKTKGGFEAFLSSAGGWRDLVDTEKLKADIYESRRISFRPPVNL